MKNNIRDLRAIHYLTQDELAERLEVSRQTIISLEKERYNPSITLAFKLAKVFNCQIEEIFTYEEE
ncbi:helix-turn-helix transcriptional regulator [Robertmurraya massiliosenegalensis]|uniref:helix-turn-helix transcriptional regulator n=1 Tax=Robertmurraya massiliosenegalensis TaxID=1287657 RepID=UPI0002F8D357|nr:helix-turn-helix transcriptional regulator [Robertmurraya massiliosenegalensis]